LNAGGSRLVAIGTEQVKGIGRVVDRSFSNTALEGRILQTGPACSRRTSVSAGSRADLGPLHADPPENSFGPGRGL